ncbi:MAG: aminomethyl-transferring glycine dehydrogenase [Gammaproteobacteria bacterium]|nr:aminomethyl-transferring glycine dehydrogenase [Gammaproteobacteria bacterium]
MTDRFVSRHIGPRLSEQQQMLQTLGYEDLDGLTRAIVPESILDLSDLDLPAAVSEEEALAELYTLAQKNTLAKNFMGMGYHGTHVPQVILRNFFQNAGWYTAYTPYQPEISQGRLELLFNYQTLVTELTGLPVANASLLDEATAAAEAMALAVRSDRKKRSVVVIHSDIHPQTLDVLNTRAAPLGITLNVTHDVAAAVDDTVCAVMVQIPDTRGVVEDFSALAEQLKVQSARLITCADPLYLCVGKTPGEMGAAIAVGSMQRFGVPMFGGGPHAAYMAVADDLKRGMPGRLVGQSIDVEGKPAYRLALQTREQHIRREKATSNICTAQALLAMAAGLYASYHGPEGLVSIATEVAAKASHIANCLTSAGIDVLDAPRFDQVTFRLSDAARDALAAATINIRDHGDGWGSVSVDQTHSAEDLEQLVTTLAGEGAWQALNLTSATEAKQNWLTQDCFHHYRSETEMMRYLRRLADRDLALDRCMIPLGSCTMKLNAASEMAPITWPEFANIHPFAPAAQRAGYIELVDQLSSWLSVCTGYAATSLQPNAGSQGEYAGLLAIADYHRKNGQSRDICLIPSSAHGTNPASAQMAGMKVVVVACDEQGNVDIDDLDRHLAIHAGKVAAIMITYPSTHGVFEVRVREVCQKVHDAGGFVYIDGANLNAMVGVARPGQFGGDVSHLNLHKTFCIPHGGGGPGVGPVAVVEQLESGLPGHRELGDAENVVSAAPFGSAGILPISWMYLRMMGPQGLREATQVALLNANYIAKRIGHVFPILYTGVNGLVAHECILDMRPIKAEYGVTVDDIAKRLIDYGFHAPTMSFPVAGTLMVEPTESESKVELDRFIDAMLAIGEEIQAIGRGDYDYAASPLANAPHTQAAVLGDWERPYSREAGACLSANPFKYWSPVARVDNVYGDKHLICSCAPISAYQ